VVLEVGPGTGNMTMKLLEKVKKVKSVLFIIVIYFLIIDRPNMIQVSEVRAGFFDNICFKKLSVNTNLINN
jgi:ubiquinone/menaquinone biosynthesis C-methylase UbiE